MDSHKLCNESSQIHKVHSDNHRERFLYATYQTQGGVRFESLLSSFSDLIGYNHARFKIRNPGGANRPQGKTAQGPLKDARNELQWMTRKRVLHREVELTTCPTLFMMRVGIRSGKSKDQRKPSGCAITRSSFPPVKTHG